MARQLGFLSQITDEIGTGTPFFKHVSKRIKKKIELIICYVYEQFINNVVYGVQQKLPEV